MEKIDMKMSEKKKQKLKEYQKHYCEANKKASLNLIKKYMTISITNF